ncbi:MAG: flagellar hook-associated protein FlgK [Hyphomonadaceae bacterium]
MSITSALNAASSGLQVTGQRAEVVANNVANASTPGFVRRALNVGENLVGGQTIGVTSNGVQRQTSDALTQERLSLSSDLTQSNILTSAWQSISDQLGNSLDENGLFQAFSDFETTLSNAATTPESTANLSALLSAADNIAQEFNTLSNDLEDLRSQTDRQIAQGVDAVNEALAQIQELNTQIAGTPLNSNKAASLFDERQRQLNTIAEYLPIQTATRDSGTIDVLTKEGVFLLSSNARTIEFSQSTGFGPDQTLASGALSGLSVDGTDITPGAATFGAISSGSLGALFQLRDQDLPQLSDQLDTLAADLITRLSDDSIDPTKTAGAAGLFVDSDNLASPGIAQRISLNSAIDPNAGGSVFRLRDGIEAVTEGPPGNNTILTNLLSAVTSVESVNANGLQGNFSSTQLAAQLTSVVGQTSVNHETVQSSTLAQHSALVEAETTQTGVDIDAQLQELLLIEQAYAANARIIEVASQLLNQLLEI